MPGARRSLRLKDYDYAHSGAYFVTVCTQDRLCLFGRIVGETMERNAAGDMVEAVWEGLPSYPGVDVDAFVVMPNHLHGIVVLSENETARSGEAVRRCGAEGRHAQWVPGSEIRPTEGTTPTRDADKQIQIGYSSDLGRMEGLPPAIEAASSSERHLALPEVMQRFKSLTTARYRQGVTGGKGEEMVSLSGHALATELLRACDPE